MQTLLRYGFVAFLFLSLTSAGIISNEPDNTKARTLSTLSKSEVKKLTKAEMEGYLGRPLSRTESLAFKINKKKLVKIMAKGQEGKTNTMAILSLAFCWLPPLGILFGTIALKQIRERDETGRGLAWTGIVICGLFTIAIFLLASMPV